MATPKDWIERAREVQKRLEACDVATTLEVKERRENSNLTTLVIEFQLGGIAQIMLAEMLAERLEAETPLQGAKQA